MFPSRPIGGSDRLHGRDRAVYANATYLFPRPTQEGLGLCEPFTKLHGLHAPRVRTPRDGGVSPSPITTWAHQPVLPTRVFTGRAGLSSSQALTDWRARTRRTSATGASPDRPPGTGPRGVHHLPAGRTARAKRWQTDERTCPRASSTCRLPVLRYTTTGISGDTCGRACPHPGRVRRLDGACRAMRAST